MKNLICVLLLLVLFSCSKDSTQEKFPLTVTAIWENATLTVKSGRIEGAKVYLYRDILIYEGYDYSGNGMLKDRKTGKTIPLFDNGITNALGEFTFSLDQGLYCALVDISDLNPRINSYWSALSTNVPDNLSPKLDIRFNIWPYTPLDLGQ